VSGVVRRRNESLVRLQHLSELLVVDEAVSVDVRLLHQLVHLLLAQTLADVQHDVAQLSCGDETPAALVDEAERLLDYLLSVSKWTIKIS